MLKMANTALKIVPNPHVELENVDRELSERKGGKTRGRKDNGNAGRSR